MTICVRCKSDQPAEAFRKNDKVCRGCRKIEDQKRYANDPRVRERHRRYAASVAGKVRAAGIKKAWQERNPEKRAAHVRVGNAVRDGVIIKPVICDRCGLGGKIHAHHADYSKPLEVDWLCTSCHSAEHLKDGTGPHAS